MDTVAPISDPPTADLPMADAYSLLNSIYIPFSISTISTLNLNSNSMMSTKPQAMLNGRPLLGPTDPNAKPVDPDERPRFLRELLEKEEWQFQRSNILKVLDIYKSGKEFRQDEEVWLFDGQVVSGFEEAISKRGIRLCGSRYLFH